MNIVDDKDPSLWRMAKKRAAFKKHLTTYVIINCMLWAIWYFTGQRYRQGIPWPMWVLVFWGVGLAFNYFDSYYGNDIDMAEREYEKLKKKKENTP